MTLDELKTRLSITDDSMDPLLLIKIEDAIDYVKRRTNQDFPDGLPPAAKMAAAQLVGYSINSSGNIKIEQIGDSSFTYKDENDLYKEVDKILIRARLIRMGFLR